MDEIDAALDFRNVSIVANYIKDRTKNAQFIIISLRCVHSTEQFSHKVLFLYAVLVTTCLNLVTDWSVFIKPQMWHEVCFFPEKYIVYFTDDKLGVSINNHPLRTKPLNTIRAAA